MPAPPVRDAIRRRDRFKGRLSLQPIQDCMAALDDPHEAFPSIHVAGTNGKGSTVHITAAMLREAGYTVGTYTQPHLADLRDRIRIDGDRIPWQAVARHHDRLTDTGVDLSFFEATTAIAVLAFRDHDVDIAVVETGLGGRLDATNIVTGQPAVITTVAPEHTAILGDTPQAIAREIAGIIPRHGTAVSGVTGPAADTVATAAADQGADIQPVAQRAAPVDDDRRPLTLRVPEAPVETGLVGDYQVDNINTALTALDVAPFTVDASAIHRGLATVQVPGRMEVVNEQPLTVLDGAHNPAGVRRMTETLDRIAQGEVTAAVSIMADKDHAAMLDALAPHVDRFILTAADIDRAAPPADLASHVDAPHETVSTPREAARTARLHAGPADTILYTGSLYFVGDVRTTHQEL